MGYRMSLKNARLALVRDDIDGAGTPGMLIIGTANMETVLATFTLSPTSFGDPAAGMMQLNGTPLTDNDAANDGVAAAAEFRDGDGNVIADGYTVGNNESGAQIKLNTVNITKHQAVSITSGVIRHG